MAKVVDDPEPFKGAKLLAKVVGGKSCWLECQAVTADYGWLHHKICVIEGDLDPMVTQGKLHQELCH